MKKKPKGGSAKRDPLLQGLPGLEFDNMTPQEVVALTPEQEGEAFLSRYLESFKTDPDGGTERFKKYFGASAKGEAWELRDIKRFYLHLVVSGRWSEAKYVAVINSIFEDKLPLSVLILDGRGKLFDREGGLGENKIPSRRRGRI